jgi:phospholipid-transporting ATPase
VGMIHEARVGVGIAGGTASCGWCLNCKSRRVTTGREGRHAANSSDFAIGQFKFLVPLILEHGRFNYIRCSKLVLYSFFKNLVNTLFGVYYALLYS